MAMPAAAWAATAPQFTRMAGSDRQATAIQFADQEYPGGPASQAVVLASGDNANLIDSVTVAPLAKAIGAPLLLTATATKLGSPVLAYLQNHQITHVFLVGAAANSTVETQLPSNLNVTLLAGATRFATAEMIAQELLQVEQMTSFNTLYIANGADSAVTDAMAADPFAASMSAPILLSAPGQAALPAVEQHWITNSSQQTVYLLGSAQNASLSASLSPDRVVDVGSPTNSPFDNAVAVAKAFIPTGGAYTAIDIANGGTVNGVPTHLIDAIPGGIWAARQGAPILFVNQDTVPASVSQFLGSSAVSPSATLTVFGGSASISDQTAQNLANLIAAPPAPSGPASLGAINISGQTLGDGTGTHPAVAAVGHTITLSTTATQTSGGSLTFQIATNGQPIPTVTSGGTVLNPTTATVFGEQSGVVYTVPVNAQGTASVDLSLSSSNGGSYSANFTFPASGTNTGAPTPVTFEFLNATTMGISPAGTQSSPVFEPVSNISNETSGLVPVTVTLPPGSSFSPSGVKVTFGLLVPTTGSRNASGPYLADTQGGQVNAVAQIAYTKTATTDANGQATIYVDSNDATANPVEVMATASAGGQSFNAVTYLNWGQPSAPTPSPTPAPSPTPTPAPAPTGIAVTAPTGLTPTAITASFSQNGSVQATEAVPLANYDASTGTVTVPQPNNLGPGTYAVSATVTTAQSTYGSSVGSVTIPGTPSPSNSVTVIAATGLSPTAITAHFSQNGSVQATESLPLSDYDPSTGAVTVPLPSSLDAGAAYDVTATVTTANGTYGSSVGMVTTPGTPSNATTVTVTAPTGLSPTTITAHFSQNGSVQATEAVGLSDYDSTTGMIRIPVPASLASGTYTVSATVETSSGSYSTTSGTVTVSATAPTTSVTAPTGLVPTSISAQFRLNGTEVASESIPVSSYDASTGTLTVPLPSSLTAGTTYDVLATVTTSSGSYGSSIGSVTVPGGSTTGSTVSVSAPSGLAPTAISANFSVNGAVATSESVPVSDYDASTGTITVPVPSSLTAGTTYDVSATITTSSGSYGSSIGSVTVPGGSTTGSTVSVSAPSGLAPTAISANFSVNGTAATTEPVPVSDYDASTGTITIPVPSSLTAGTSYDVSATITTSSGSYGSSIGSYTVPGGSTNASTVAVSAPSGLAPTAISANFSVNGTVATTEPVPVSDYDASTGTITIPVPTLLNAGTTYQVSATVSTSNGSYGSSIGSYTVPGPTSNGNTLTLSSTSGLTPVSVTATFSFNNQPRATEFLTLSNYDSSTGTIAVTPIPSSLPAGTYSVVATITTANGTYTSNQGTVVVP